MANSATAPIQTAAVVGGGISGLVSALQLARAGNKVVLFEAQDVVGGLIRSAQIGSVQIDVGAEAFAVTRPNTLQLIEELGLGHLIETPSRSDARIFSNEQTYELPHGVLGIPSSLDDHLLVNAVGKSAVEQARNLDTAPWQLEYPGTVAELVLTRLGEPFLERLVAPILAGVHASDPSLLEVNAVAPQLFELAKRLGSLVLAAKALRASSARPGAAVAGLRGGMHTLITALEFQVQSSGVEIRKNTSVLEIHQNSAGFNLTLISDQSASPETIHANQVVVATAPKVASKVLKNLPELSGPLGQITMVDVTVVALAVSDTKLDSAPLGSGVLVSADQSNIGAKASTHSSAKWAWLKNELGPGKHILRFSYGRNGQVPAADDSLVAQAKADASVLFGISPNSVEQVVIQEWPESLVQAKTGHGQLVVAIDEALSNQPNLAIVGSGLGGNGITGILARTKQELERLGVNPVPETKKEN